MTETIPKLGDDLMRGAGALAEWLLGADTPKNRRSIYHWHETRQLPTFQIGAQICARKSTLRAHVERQESEAQVA